MDTFLAPIERPKGLVMKLAYYFTRRQFGKVISPLKVFSVRLPTSFGLFYNKVSQLDKKLVLSPELVSLIRIQVAKINVCTFCVDIGRYAAAQEGQQTEKIDTLPEFASSGLFSEAEKAALEFVTVLTQEKKMDQTQFAHLQQYYSEREICEIVWLAASEHLYNITNIGLNIHSDMLCNIRRK